MRLEQALDAILTAMQCSMKLIVLLKDKDKYREYLQNKPFDLAGYDKDPTNFENVTDWIKSSISEMNNSSERMIFFHIIDDDVAVDKLTSIIFNDIQHIVVNDSLARGGLL